MAEQERPASVLVVIPTYNERENLAPVVARLHDALPAARVLVVDDDSPDGTGDLADELATGDGRIHVLHRTEKAGLGAAYLAGFAWALQAGYQVVVEMDADGSHPPEQLPQLVEALADADLVIGSRYVDGGAVVNWPAHRRWLSSGGNMYCRLALGVQIRDVTAGYRAFRRRVLAELDLGDIASQGYCFQVDLAWRAVLAGFRVSEVPITFTERVHGRSKMSPGIVAEALGRVTWWGLTHRAHRIRRTARRSVSA